MSFKFTNFTVSPYIGSLAGQNVGICKPSKYDPTVVPIVIDWSKYPTGGVQVNLQASGVINSIDFIRSVVIDNLGQAASVEVYFPDTGFTMACQSGAQISGYAFTFQLQVLIFNGSTTPAGFTTVYLCNFLVDTYLQTTLPFTANVQQVSSTTPGSQNYSVPAAGSNLSIVTSALSPASVNTTLFGGAKLSGNIVVTSASVKLLGCYSAGQSPLALVIEIDDNLATNWFRWQCYAPNDGSILPLLDLGQQTAVQIKMPATRQYSLVNFGNATPGFMQLTISWDWLA